MNSAAIAFLSLACLYPAPKTPENPLLSAEDGDWTEYKLTAFILDGEGREYGGVCHTMRMIVVAKSDREIALKVFDTVESKEESAQIIEIAISKNYDPIEIFLDKKGTPGPVLKIGEGTERLPVGGVNMECVWVKKKVGKEKGHYTLKSWVTKEVPARLAKLEMDNGEGKYVLEWSRSGKKRD